MSKGDRPGLLLPFENKRIIRIRNSVYTETETPQRVYGEEITKINNRTYREWDPRRSKPAAAILNGLRRFPIRENDSVLYLGASTGTTISHISDICPAGTIYGVEVSYEPFSKLLDLAKKRNNLYPILEDANSPEKYSFFIEHVDVMYQDISQRNQIQIFKNNVNTFNPKRGFLVLKIRSVKSTEDSRSILNTAMDQLSVYHLKEVINLKPYDTDHYLITLDT
ncbi:fibrillarin-like pre-rRNA processing protein [Thermoplasma volcanium GSS1]|uniref:Fibrillarin-like rRNA/tRNA 2'-O-methyltransferase n=1 Tax=Thermoplasma volcanium (strain ATCC 51530 / DSM 4299 / JCM 9571 / NBRC 15438 / GSS1) TaxID=273116 RepID=FLPA_THEVO|nr:fibrillarin-like rRNA/tRNA 2'-O-methyltransferase [Thermoplasma volcanium]Q979P2.1 RecName: Full=Fibrillarin-like rRNA/tRNA 2'-O-methyltransferase [Thermoplasma volcanium GSS1]BAB60260.1 fibrillarin-like pre-rRNA processing protein [Thermoplasma volcanium GSS1]